MRDPCLRDKAAGFLTFVGLVHGQKLELRARSSLALSFW